MRNEEHSFFAIGVDPISIARIARISYSRETKDATVEELVQRVNDLYSKGHFSVFEHNVMAVDVSFMDKKELAYDIWLLMQNYPGLKLWFYKRLLITDLRTIVRVMNNIDAYDIVNTDNNRIKQILLKVGTKLLDFVLGRYTGNGLVAYALQKPQSEEQIIRDVHQAYLGSIRLLFEPTILRTLSDATEPYDTLVNLAYAHEPLDTILSTVITNCEVKEDLNRLVTNYLCDDNPYLLYSWYIKAPIYVMRQWMRHRHGVFNELSRRYVGKNFEFAELPCNYKSQDTDTLEYHRIRQLMYQADVIDIAQRFYEFLKSRGLKSETARTVLPLALLTKVIWTVPKYSLDNFIRLRTDKHAQYEIRLFAQVLKQLVD